MQQKMTPNNFIHQSCSAGLHRDTLNRLIHRATGETTGWDLVQGAMPGGQQAPELFASQIDVTQVSLAFGKWALPKLSRELLSGESSLARQAITILSDLVVNSEKLCHAIELGIPDNLTPFLLSEDSYMREMSARIFSTLAGQAQGRHVILRNPQIIKNLSRGLEDPQASVRTFVAQIIHNLALDLFAANSLMNSPPLSDTIVKRLFEEENEEILINLLTSLEILLLRCIHEVSNRVADVMKALTRLLVRENESVLSHALGCLAVLCEGTPGKVKAIEMNFLKILKTLLDDSRATVHSKASTVIAFVTILDDGKQRASEFVDRLVELAGNSEDEECRMMSIKALTNIAEVPAVREIMLQSHSMFIEDIDTCYNDVIEHHKNQLLAVIRWCH